MTKSSKQETTEAEETAAPSEKKERVRVIQGIPCRILRTYYSPESDRVIDVIERKRSVKDKHGNFKDVVLERHTTSDDEELQKKFCRRYKDEQREVEIDV